MDLRSLMLDLSGPISPHYGLVLKGLG